MARLRGKRAFRVGWTIAFSVFLGLALLFSSLSLGPDEINILADSLIWVVAAGAVLFCIWKLWRSTVHTAEDKVSGFRNEPWKFDRKIIELRGTVVRTFSDSLTERIKRKLVDKIRKLKGDKDPSDRYMHQMFILAGDGLRKGENIFVLHNVEFGRVALRPGMKVEVRGEYIHQRARSRRGAIAPKRTFYGRLHKTHEPHGYLRVVR